MFIYLELRSNTNATSVVISKNDLGKGMEGGEKSVCVAVFWPTRRSRFRGGKNYAFWGIL